MLVRWRTGQLRGLTSSSSSSSSFVFDGTNSDIARQLFTRHQAGDSDDRVNLTSIPAAVLDRLNPLNIDFHDLPGLVQRAVLWDTGFSISPGNDPVQIWTMHNHSMADLAVPKYQVTNVDCTYLNCSQPNGVTAHYSQYCTGWQMLNVSRCVADVFEDPGAGTYLGMMWSVGGDPDMTPLIRLRDHTWTQDIAEFGGNITFSVYVVHTVPHELDPAWNECPHDESYASLTVPCHRRDEYSDEEVAANMTKPTGSAWVNTWLETEFAREKSEFDTMLLVPIIVGILFVLWFCWQCRSKQKLSTARGDTRRSSLSNPNYCSPNVNQTLQILFGSEYLQGKRISFENLSFRRLASRGASGEIWVCEYNGRQVAAKRLHTKDLNAVKVQAFAEEIELTARLVHPNIVEFIGVVWNSLSNLTMVIEFYPKGCLQDYLHKNKNLLSWGQEKMRITVGIAKALEYLHAHSPPLIHRDVKSNNVLISNELEPKLIDFGVSRVVLDLTMTAGIGTPFWTAPEVLEGDRYTEQADIYSFGVVLSELDMCKTPYTDAVTEGGSKARHFQILQEVMAGELRPNFSEDCPSRVLRVAMACLSLDPSSRPTASEVIRQLDFRV
ncbi:TKL/DRK protein kinase [Phytophthora nicotianae INRA-310]|uniref:TKL/DRK protein kinase n=1 Tax=Phytophthora nicotianae (strain INRA-310) TaxID=761204 RepID=W2PRD6_PHYN3|nr:TKL/DRK protein kinase [Phytophthora nicotianae INRA-310]ETN02570.1 TKL/DRK protein kinase [Phytophthora nicotianae INRA-310]